MNQDIKFGFWNYAPFGILDNKEAVLDWKNCGSNLPMSFVYDHSVDKKKDMLELLDECQKHGLKLIISDIRTPFTRLRTISKEEYEKDVIEAYKDFGKHPATFGFYIGDEPSPDESDLFILAANIVLKNMPGLVPFGNLLPYFDGFDEKTNLGTERPHYEALLARIIKESKLPVIGYDQYTQNYDEYYHPEAGINAYFNGLEIYHKVTKTCGVPFYVSLLSVGHWMYKVPTEDMIRWQISTAFAHGARGVIWFYFYQNDIDLSYREAPFTGYLLRKTPMFDVISRQQYIFKTRYEEQFNKMELEDVYHLNHIYKENQEVKESEFIKELKIERDFPVIVSTYKEFDSDKRFISFVNGSQTHANLFRLTWKNEKKETFWLAPGELALFSLDDIFNK